MSSSNKYFYAGSRVNALAAQLLSHNDLERLLGAKDTHESIQVLHDTFLAPHIARYTENQVNKGFSESIQRARELLDTIAPEKEILHVLWLKYDFLNIRTITKGLKQGYSDEVILESLYTSGLFPPTTLLNHYKEKKLQHLSPFFSGLEKELDAKTHSFDIDIMAEKAYFNMLAEVKKNTTYQFVKEYITLRIDFYNIKTALRYIYFLQEQYPARMHVTRGTVSATMLDTEQNCIQALNRFGGEHRWKEALQNFQQKKESVFLDRMIDEYILEWLSFWSKKDPFSPASLFFYFYAHKNNIQIARALVTAKANGIPEDELRIIMRKKF